MRFSPNIRIAYILSFFNELYFPVTAWLFFYLKYLDFPQIAILTGIGGIASNLLEIPTGAFADRVGRKTAVFLSYILFSIGMFGIAFSTTFWVFLIFTLINSLCNALYSGSLEALVYDTLKEERQEEHFDKVITKMEAFIWIGLFIGAISGGFMYQYWFRLPFLIQGIITIIGALIALGLKEPHIDSKKYDMKLFLKQNIVGFKELFANIKIAQLSIVFIVVGAGYFIASSILGISQLKQYGMNPSDAGIIFAIGFIISAAVSFIYPKLKQKLGVRTLFIGVIGALLASFLFANFVGVLLGSMVVIGRIASSTTFRNTRSIIMNRYLSSENRATSLSTLVLLSQLPYALFAYPIGIYIEKTSPNQFAFVLGIILITLLLLQFLGFNLKKKFE